MVNKWIIINWISHLEHLLSEYMDCFSMETPECFVVLRKFLTIKMHLPTPFYRCIFYKVLNVDMIIKKKRHSNTTCMIVVIFGVKTSIASRS